MAIVLNRRLFAQLTADYVKWFDNLVVTVSVDKPHIFIIYSITVQNLICGRISHAVARENFKNLFVDYPLLKMGLSIFLVKEACFDSIPRNLLRAWRDEMLSICPPNSLPPFRTFYLNMEMLQPDTTAEVRLFQRFLDTQANYMAIINGSYGYVLVMRKRRKTNEFLLNIPDTNYTMFLMFQGLEAIKMMLYRLINYNNADAFWTLKIAMDEFRNCKISAEDVCAMVFGILRKHAGLFPLLIDFNRCVPYLAVHEYFHLERIFQ